MTELIKAIRTTVTIGKLAIVSNTFTELKLTAAQVLGV